jgi:hypothetical protein
MLSNDRVGSVSDISSSVDLKQFVNPPTNSEKFGSRNLLLSIYRIERTHFPNLLANFEGIKSSSLRSPMIAVRAMI